MRHFIRAAAALAALCVAAPATAQQQQWAAAYVNWRFSEATPATLLEQDIQIPQPARASFFTLNLNFTTGDGGYIGLQSDEAGAHNVRFSLWNASAARGDACRRFDGEGEGMTCILPWRIDPAAAYRVRVERAEADGEGQWWRGWIDDVAIGELRVAPGLTQIDPASAHNFSEYWGDAVPACASVALSAAVFAAPRADAVNAGNPQGTRPDGHPCATGREPTGAVAHHLPTTLNGAPAMIVTLGGADFANRTLAARVRAATPNP